MFNWIKTLFTTEPKVATKVETKKAPPKKKNEIKESNKAAKKKQTRQIPPKESK